jgi:hypothetical protein
MEVEALILEKMGLLSACGINPILACIMCEAYMVLTPYQFVFIHVHHGKK